MRNSFKLVAGLIFGLLSGALFAGQNSKNNATSPELIITETHVIFGDSGVCTAGVDTITINGINFDNGADPVVVLGDQGRLSVCLATDDTIVAECPSGFCAHGDYLLEVITGEAVTKYDEYDLTIGAVGPRGEQGLTGPAGPSPVNQICPTGWVMIGIDSNADIICSQVPQGPIDTDPPDPDHDDEGILD